MTAWEYHSYVFERGDDTVKILNKFGEKGWEAFHFVVAGDRSRVLFKRHKPEATTTQEKTQ